MVVYTYKRLLYSSESQIKWHELGNNYRLITTTISVSIRSDAVLQG